MLRFNENQLVSDLAVTSSIGRVAFAAACAERLLPAYARFAKATGRGDAPRLRWILDRLWADLEGNPIAEGELQQAIEMGMALIPRDDEGPWTEEQAYAEDAAAAVVYALRCRRSGTAQEAVWAARRTYEAVDHFVVNTLIGGARAAGAEERILAHRIMQAELARQSRDVYEILHMGVGPAFLRERARAESSSVFA